MGISATSHFTLPSYWAGLTQLQVTRCGWPPHWSVSVQVLARLYLYRYWDWEKRLAEDLLVRARLPDLDIDDNALSQALTAVFPAGLGSSDQKVAAALSVFRPLSVITGGPGSGKTTTVVRTVALLQAVAGMPAGAFTLAAPTGKAAARLREVFVQSVTLPGLENLQLPERTTTIHRLLGIHAADGNPVHNARNPLTCRVLVVDEASMIDLGLMVKLVEAMPRHARLILLGDRDQLASVEAGSVLEDVCNGAQGLPEVLAARLGRVTGVHDVSGATPGNAAPLAGSLAVLQDSWRYDRTSDIGRLASAVQAGDVSQTIDCLQNPVASATTLLPYQGQPGLARLLIERIVSGYSQCLSLAIAGAPAHRVFECYRELRVLCAHRSGISGVSGINRLIEQQLIKTGQIPAGVSWYPGRPVIILSNDYRLGLFNGDMGIALVDPNRPAQVAVYFPQPSGGYRAVWPIPGLRVWSLCSGIARAPFTGVVPGVDIYRLESSGERVGDLGQSRHTVTRRQPAGPTQVWIATSSTVIGFSQWASSGVVAAYNKQPNAR